ncbi:MAG: glycosyltransferase family 4 protein [Bacteroidota bacterium]
MRILLSTPVFKPMVGGMETMADNLARHFTARGHQVTVVTPIAATEADGAPYAIVRQPSGRMFYRLVSNCDLVFSNGASLYAAPWVMLTGKPTVMRHTAYQVSCIDGAGWYGGEPAPLSHWASFGWHLRKGYWRQALRGIPKTLLLRFFAHHFVSANVAISDWMRERHPLPNQIRIHNPFPIHKFVAAKNTNGQYAYDFFFLGRLISEKGIDVLLRAFARQAPHRRLCLIGDGPERSRLERLTAELGLTDRVTFCGTLRGPALLEQIRVCRIAVLPSTWEEPFGGVATEIMAAGKNMIVSRNGALAEIVGPAGLTFTNGEFTQLASAMERLVGDESLQKVQRAAGAERIKDFDEERLIDQYEQLFSRLLHHNQSTAGRSAADPAT